MKLLDTITVNHQGTERSILLCVGDLAALPAHEAVDMLVVSAFPDDYEATPRSLIGALHRSGVSVAELAKDKEVDLRTFSSCWLSRQVRTTGVNFNRVLCFEPRYRGRAPEVVGDIFRSVVPLIGGTPAISTIAMPLVASGDQGEPAEAMLESLLDAALHWLSAGLALDRIVIVLHESADTESLLETFDRVKLRHSESSIPLEAPPEHRFDVFVSYSHKDKKAVDKLVAGLKAREPSLRIFLDRLELNVGAAWQQHIFESLDSSRKVICVYSPDYILSKVCNEEFNIALMRHREESGVLVPLYLRNAKLPGYMKLLHHLDAREADPSKIAASADKLVRLLQQAW